MHGPAAMNLWSRWRDMPKTDRHALPGAAWRLVTVRCLMTVCTIQRTQALVAPRKRQQTAIPLTDPEPWHSRTRALQRIGHRLPATQCIARSITLWWWMRSAGHDPQLRMGLHHDKPTPQGHAWVECDGHLFDETRQGAARQTDLDWPSADK